MNLFKKRTDTLNRDTGRQRDPISRQPGNAMGPNRTFSYYASRSQSDISTGRESLQSKVPLRRLPSRFQRLRKHVWWFVGVLLLSGCILYNLQLSTTPKIVALTGSATTPFLQPSETYQQSAKAMFTESAANRNKLTVNTADIARRLRGKYPEIQQVSVSLPVIGSTPTIYIRPAEPAMVLAAPNGTFIVDENGRALAEATAGMNLSRLRVPSVTDQSGLTVNLGQQVLPRSAASFIRIINSQLQQQKIAIQSMTLPAAAGELDVYISGKPYFIKFNLEQGSEDQALLQVGTFVAVMKQLAKQGTAPNQYVDVRLEGRAYYK